MKALIKNKQATLKTAAIKVRVLMIESSIVEMVKATPDLFIAV